MGEVTSKQTKLAETAVAKANVIAKTSTLTKKIALTKKLEQTEKQIIVTQGQTKQTSLAEGNSFLTNTMTRFLYMAVVVLN